MLPGSRCCRAPRLRAAPAGGYRGSRQHVVQGHRSRTGAARGRVDHDDVEVSLAHAPDAKRSATGARDRAGSAMRSGVDARVTPEGRVAARAPAVIASGRTLVTRATGRARVKEPALHVARTAVVGIGRHRRFAAVLSAGIAVVVTRHAHRLARGRHALVARRVVVMATCPARSTIRLAAPLVGLASVVGVVVAGVIARVAERLTRCHRA